MEAEGDLMSREQKEIEMERSWLENEMMERLARKKLIDPEGDPITYHRREVHMNEAIDEYADLLRMVGSTAIDNSPAV
jgi:hypothetical protein